MLRYQGKLFAPDVDSLRGEILEKLMGLDILFIQVPQKCIVILKRSIGGMD